MASRFGSLAKFALAAAGLMTLLVGLSRLVYPHDVGQYEADVWAPADAMAHGHLPYYTADATTPPYVVASYGPLYYAFIAVGVRLFGDQFFFGRALALAALAVSAISVSLIVRRYSDKGSPFMALLGAGLFLAQYPVQAVAGIQAPDMVGLAFALSGLAVLVSAGPANAQRHAGRAVLAGCLLAAAVVVRQPLVLPAAVAFVWYGLHRYRRGMLAFALTVMIIGVAAFAVLQSTSHGGFFWYAVRLQSAVPFSFSQTRSLALTYLRSPATIFTLVLLVFALLRRRSQDARAAEDDATGESRLMRRLLLAYLAAAVALAAVTSAKIGAAINYWLEVAAVLSILTPLYLGPALDLGSTPDFRRRRQLWSSDWLALFLATLIFASALVTGAREAHGQVLQWRALPYVNEVVADIRAMTARRELVYVEYPDLAVSAGRRYVFNDLALYQSSSLLSGLYRRVFRSNRFRLIVSLAPVPPPGYVPVCLRHAPPAGVYDVRVYYRAHGPSTSSGSCIQA